MATIWDETMAAAIALRNEMNALINRLNNWVQHGSKYEATLKATELGEIQASTPLAKIAAGFDGSLPAPPEPTPAPDEG